MDYSIVVPVYNEEKVLPEFYRRVSDAMKSTGEYEVVFVDDGSTDSSLEIIKSLAAMDPHIKYIKLSRNFGQQVAISAGLDFAGGRAIVFIDVDLQDPPEVILQMIEKWKMGGEVVYGKRASRKGEGILKQITANIFYRTLNVISQYKFPVDSGEFKLIDRKVAEALRKFREKSRYVRGIISWLGFNKAEVVYVRDRRFAGSTKYPFTKMIKLSLDAITSFSYLPLKFAMYLGFVISFCSFIYLLVVFYQKLFTNTTIIGWASLIAINLFFNGIVLMILGVYGEYIGRIYEESKNRPLYVVSETKGFKGINP